VHDVTKTPVVRAALSLAKISILLARSKVERLYSFVYLFLFSGITLLSKYLLSKVYVIREI
jgi:hypothetical protein